MGAQAFLMVCACDARLKRVRYYIRAIFLVTHFILAKQFGIRFRSDKTTAQDSFFSSFRGKLPNPLCFYQLKLAIFPFEGYTLQIGFWAKKHREFTN
jgi:hypothetical protein